MSKRCPVHNLTLAVKSTRFGGRYSCPIHGCKVYCWEGPTSTPATPETMDLRHRCHAAFDPLWKRKIGKKPLFKTRSAAYEWLSEVMTLPPSESHIGMMNGTQCKFLLEKIDELKNKRAVSTAG